MPARKRSTLVWAAFLVLGGFLGTGTFRLLRDQRAVEATAQAACRTQSRQAAQAVQGVLAGMQGQVHSLVQDLDSGRLGPRDLGARLAETLARAPASAARMGVLFQPFAAGPAQRLFGPYAERSKDGIRPFGYETAGDYTQLPWYRFDLGKACWNEPHPDPATGDLLVDYSETFHLPGATGPSGVVRVEVTLEAIQAMVGSLAPGSSGYGFLLSDRSVYLADPVDAKVRNGERFTESARACNDEVRLRLVPAVEAHRAGFAEGLSALTGQSTWIFLEPIPLTGWVLGMATARDELVLAPPGLKPTLVQLVALSVGFSLAGLYLLLGLGDPDSRRLWVFSLAGSLLIGAGTCALWHFAYSLHQQPKDHEVEVMSLAGRDALLKRYASLGQGLKEVVSRFIPTGIFIQQLEANGDSLMRISGQVWEKFPKGLPAEEQGIVFPEAVSCEVGPPLVRQEGDFLVHIYPFHGVFRMESGSTVTYPFDKSSVRLRLWPKLLYSNTMLVPDLEAYTLLVPVALPGIDRGLSLSGWQLGQSHFSFIEQSYNMNLGIKAFTGQQDSPELVYTFTLKRNFINPFIATFLPILVVVGLLFAILCTTCRTKELMAVTGYNAINVLRSIISLFFPVVVSQINLRNHILTEGLLYVEYYYFVIYCLILLVGLNALAVAFWEAPFLLQGDNRNAKLLFWPILSTAFFAISTLYLG